MVDLAVEAYNTNNFGLAVDIYARNIKEHGPKLDWYIGLANSYAKAGKLREAFEAYSNAFRLGKVKSEQLSQLVGALVDIMTEKENLKSDPKAKKEKTDIFSCFLCKSMWTDPVTLTCGHTFCRKCIEKSQTKICKICTVKTHTKLSSLKTNILLNSMAQQWFPEELEAVRLKSEGNKHFEKHKFHEAIGAYTKAHKYAPKDHLLLSNRSYAYACLNHHQEALEDAEKVIGLRPDWPKGYYRKGSAHSGLHQHEEAALAYLQCLTLDPDVASARNALAKCLQKLLSPMAMGESQLKQAELQSVFNPSPLSRVLGGNAMPVLTPDMLHRMKSSLRESLWKAGVLTSDDTADTNQFGSGASSPVLTRRPTANLEKYASAPNLSHHSDSEGGSLSRSSSDASLESLSISKLSRKRSCDVLCKKKGSSSPVRESPLKHAKPDDKNHRFVPAELLNKEDFECSLCFRLLYHPVTTPCGHSFCRQCLDRCLDHNANCPLCKTTLAEYLAERRQNATEAIVDILQCYFPDHYAERKKVYDEEMAELARMGSDQHEIPIFVCTMAYPTIRCPLHIFEPRYRLMIRQCMESGSRQFGMCVAFEDEQNFADYGCMLEINDVQYFPDGRSVVDTIGGRRFKVLSRSQRDGYSTAKVEFIKDHLPDSEEDKQELQKLHDEVHKEAHDWYGSVPTMMGARIRQNLGEFPEREPSLWNTRHGPAWTWWIIAVLPLDARAQLAVIGMTSLKDRLLAIRRILTWVKRRGSQ